MLCIFAGDMERLDRIIEGALKLFLKQGVKATNMDDVAKHLGMSKKTLYQYVDNKTDLVEQCFRHYQSAIIEMIESIQEKNENAIDELFEIDEQVCHMLKNRPPMLINDVKNHYPSVWTILDEIKKKHIFNCVTQNMKNGKDQALYREDVDINIIAKLMMNTVDALVDDEIFPLTEYDFKKLLKENRVYHIRGIATQKGINYLEEKLKNE